MINIRDLKAGDHIKVVFDDMEREGVVVNTDLEENKVLVDNGIQEFWYDPEQLFAIPLNEDLLLKMGFEKEAINGSTKYLRGPFRIVTPKTGDFSQLEMWYREDRRTFDVHLPVHELQNLYLQMTKVPLDMP